MNYICACGYKINTNPTNSQVEQKHSTNQTMDIETAEFIQNKVGMWPIRKIQLFLQCPTAKAIQVLLKSQTQLLKIPGYDNKNELRFCSVKMLKIIDRDPEEMINTIDLFCCSISDYDVTERGYDFLDFNKGYYYINMIEGIGPCYTPIKIKKQQKKRTFEHCNKPGMCCKKKLEQITNNASNIS